MKYEIFDDNGVTYKVVVAEESFVAEKYPGHYREFVEPVLVVSATPPPPLMIVSKVAFISRFTPQEYVGVVGATKTDVEVQAWYDLFQAANIVDLADQRTVAGVNSFVTKNLLTQARADEILNDPVQPNERP